jgi:hypothetical protein
VTVRGQQLAIDWQQNGFTGGSLQDASSYVNDDDVVISWGRNMSGDVTLESISGGMSFGLVNDTQVFSQENVSSPIYGNILPNRDVRYQVTQPASGGTTYTLLQGVLDDFSIDGDPISVFSGKALDAWGRPGGEKLSTPLYSGLRTGDAINLVLDAIGWTGGRDIDPGATVMPWWWEEGTDATTAVNKIVHSEGPPAIAYVRGGTFVFADRHHRILDARSQASQGTYTHTIPAGAVPGDFKIEAGSFSYDHGAKRIINSATFSVGIRTASPIGEVWTSEDPVTIAAGGTLTVVVQASDPFLNAVTPDVASGDIVVQSGTVSSVTLSRTSGQTAFLTIGCSADTVITRLALRAASVPVSRTVQVSASDASSKGNFGVAGVPGRHAAGVGRAVRRPGHRHQDCRRLCQLPAGHHSDRRRPERHLPGRDPRLADLRPDHGPQRRPRHQRRFHDRAAEAPHHQPGIVHRLEITCQAAEPVQPTNIFTFNVAGKGFNQGAFRRRGHRRPEHRLPFRRRRPGLQPGRFRQLGGSVDHAVARYDWGRWVADCPNPACTNAMQLDRGQARYECRFPLDDQGHAFGGCGTVAPLGWPDDPKAIEVELAGMPESQRQWRPAPPEPEDEQA